MRVLIVDDSRFDRERTLECLDGVAELHACESGERARELLAARPFDLVVSDIQMPGMSGLDLLEQARREQPATDFVLLTGDATVESAIGALRRGAADYLLKPVQPEQLRRVVEQVLTRQQLLAENRQLRDSLRTLEACRALVSSLDAGEIYSVALDILLGALSRVRGFAVFQRTAGPMSDGTVFRGFSENEARSLRRLLLEEKPTELRNLERIELLESGALHDLLERSGIARELLLAVPVHGPDREAGLLCLLQDGRDFEPDELVRAGIVASHARAALGNAERYEHAKERAFIDDVTEVYNARYLLSAAENEIRRAERYQSDLSVLFLDLDRFKLVNDRHGHLVGSQTLRNLSHLLEQCVRQVDTLARYGGDEFTILLVDTPHDEARVVAERIRRNVEEHVFEAGRGASLRLTVSVGIGTYPQHGRSRDVLLDAADKAMYLAKSRGRNRVCSADELGEIDPDSAVC